VGREKATQDIPECVEWRRADEWRREAASDRGSAGIPTHCVRAVKQDAFVT